MRKYFLLALSLLGLFDSLYLWWAYTSPSRPMVCASGGCETVRASAYAHLWGHALPVYGVTMYAALVLLIFAHPLLELPILRRMAQAAVAGIAGLGFLFSVYLTGLEAFVIHAWCAWCLASAIAVTLILLAGLWELIRPEAAPDRAAAVGVVQRQFGMIVLAGLVGAPAFVYLKRLETPSPIEKASWQVVSQRLVRPDSHAVGSPQAPLTVVEFGDFECPLCGQEEAAVQQIRRRFGGSIRFVFRQFPIASIHPQAAKAAEASECAAEQGKFWEMHDRLYASQKDLDPSALERSAAAIGLDQPRFNQCLESGATAERVQKDLSDGQALHVRGTPTFFIGDQVIEGELPYPKFAWLINQALTGGGSDSTPEASSESGASGTSANPSSKRLKGDPGNGNSNGASNPSASVMKSDGGTESAANSGSTFSGGLGSPGTPFALSGSSELFCTPDQEKKRQPTEIRTNDAKNLYHNARSVFVDVRPAVDFAKGHVQGAMNIPVDQMEQRWSTLPKDRTIVLYESGTGSGNNVCAMSRAAGRILFNHGFDFDLVKVYQDGLADWSNAGLPLQR